MKIIYGMIACFVVFLICNSLQLSMDNNPSRSSAQTFLIICTFLFGFLALPLTAVYFLGAHSQVSRLEYKHQQEHSQAVAGSDRVYRDRIHELEQRLAKYDVLIHEDRKRAYNEGFTAGCNSFVTDTQPSTLPTCELEARIIQLEKENKALKNQIADVRLDSYYEGQSAGERSGFRSGYRYGVDSCLSVAQIPAEDIPKIRLRSLMNIDQDIHAHTHGY